MAILRILALYSARSARSYSASGFTVYLRKWLIGQICGRTDWSNLATQLSTRYIFSQTSDAGVRKNLCYADVLWLCLSEVWMQIKQINR